MGVAHVQDVQGDSATSATTLTLTLGGATTAGNCLVACISSSASVTNNSVSGVTLGGSAGNWASLVSAGTGAGEAITGIWADPSCAGGQTSVVVSVSGGSGSTVWLFARVYEFSGLAAATSGLLDKSSTATASSSSWSSGTTAATTHASEAWVGLVITDSTTITGPASPWSNGAQLTSTLDFMSGYQVRTATGTAAYSGTFAGSESYIAVVACLAPAPQPNGLLMSAFA